MSDDTRFRIYLDGAAASSEQLDLLETINVEQEVDMAWAARLQIPVCLDGRGSWRGLDDDFMALDSRVRIEVAPRNGDFVPLIDGPVIGRKPRLEREPGQSSLTVTVTDDTRDLSHDEEQIGFDEGTSIRDIVAGMLDGRENIRDTDIDEDLDRTPEDAFELRGNRTAMSLLRCLGHVYERRAYVLPGDTPGASIGCFKRFPDAGRRAVRGLPALVLNGEDANFTGFDANLDLDLPEETRAAAIRISDKQLISWQGSYRDRSGLGDSDLLTGGIRPARRRLRPSPCAGMDLERATASRAEQSALAFEATGRTLEGCYPGVLRPYRLVEVRLGETPMSGDWAVFRVSHSLSSSSYAQTFTLRRDAGSKTPAARESEAARSEEIF